MNVSQHFGITYSRSSCGVFAGWTNPLSSYHRLLLVALFAAGLNSSPIHASSGGGVVFDNGAPTFSYGTEMSGFQVADDFLLPTQTEVSRVRFWSTEGYPYRTSTTFDGHLDYWIYNAVNNSPGPTLLVQGVGQSVQRISHGLKYNIGNEPLTGFETVIDFEAPFIAQAGTQYYLALHLQNSYPSPHDEMYWSTAPGSIPLGHAFGRSQGIGTWIDRGVGVGGVYGAGHLAFQIFGSPVPEPGSLSILLSCLLMPLRLWIRNRR